MVKSILSLCLFSLVFYACHRDDNKLVIEGELINLTNPYVIASSRVSDTIRLDTISVDKNGKFSYTQIVDTATFFTFYFNDYSSSTIVFSDKGVNKIKMKGDVIFSDLIEIKGGEINESLTTFKLQNETLLKHRNLLMSKHNLEVDSLENSLNIISDKEQIASLNSLNHELSQKVEEFIISNPDKISSVILINEFFKNNENPETLNRVLEYLEDDALKSPLTLKLKNHNQKLMLSAEGAKMPSFKLKDDKDKSIESSDFENKYLLISFLSFKSDETTENIKILKDEYKFLDKKDIEFLSIYIDSDTLPIINHSIDSIPWRIVIEDKSWGSDIVDIFNVHYLPFNILIDPKGIIVARDVPINDIKNIINTTTDKSKS
ncbi:MAG: redoxin domain-containing protein [Bacteroidales bacterium]|nr:redoxin domain-containing protein [Bacteroidales bacterium]